MNKPSGRHVDLSAHDEDVGVAVGAEELGRLVDAEPQRAGAAEHRVRFVVPLKPQQRLGLQRHYLADFIVTDKDQNRGVNASPECSARGAVARVRGGRAR